MSWKRVADLTPREPAERDARDDRLGEHPHRGDQPRVRDAARSRASRRPRPRAAQYAASAATNGTIAIAPKYHDHDTEHRVVRRRRRRTRTPRRRAAARRATRRTAGRARRARAARGRAAGGPARAATPDAAAAPRRAAPSAGSRAVAADHALLVGELVPRQHEEAARAQELVSPAGHDLGAALAAARRARRLRLRRPRGRRRRCARAARRRAPPRRRRGAAPRRDRRRRRLPLRRPPARPAPSTTDDRRDHRRRVVDLEPSSSIDVVVVVLVEVLVDRPRRRRPRRGLFFVELRFVLELVVAHRAGRLRRGEDIVAACENHRERRDCFPSRCVRGGARSITPRTGSGPGVHRAPVGGRDGGVDGRVQETVGAAGWPGLHAAGGLSQRSLLSLLDGRRNPLVRPAPLTVAGDATATVCGRRVVRLSTALLSSGVRVRRACTMRVGACQAARNAFDEQRSRPARSTRRSRSRAREFVCQRACQLAYDAARFGRALRVEPFELVRP